MRTAVIGWALVFATLLVATLLVASSRAQGEWPPTFRLDANLYDVCFVDAQTGWAVGDRGAILKTSDGGRQWHLQESPVACRLESVHFVDSERGWAVGGHSVPYTHRAQGVILQTRDGGQHWELLQGHFLPWLTHVQFLDEDSGYAVGLTSAMFPASVFRTRDGGQHWTPCPGTTSGGVDASFHGSGRGWILERDGRISRVDQMHLKRPPPRPKTAVARRLVHLSPVEGIAVGQRGYIAWTYDGGATWSPPNSLADQSWRTQFDWLAVDGEKAKIWVAGVPGTKVLHSADGGLSWQVYQTGQVLPLFALDFVDANQGWAVGALGTILATEDGGKTWKQQADRPRRVAVCAVASQRATIPWEFLSQVSAGDGFLSAIEVLSGPPAMEHVSGEAPLAMRLQEATSSYTGSLANVIQALPEIEEHLGLDSRQIRQRWDQAMGGDSQEALTEYLVRQLRMLRPEVVVIGDPQPTGAHEITRRIVEQAIRRAGDASSFPDQLHAAGLSAWAVPLTVRPMPSGAEGSYRVTPLRLALPVGRSVQNLSDAARSRVAKRQVAIPDQLFFEVLNSSGEPRQNHRRASRLLDATALMRGDRMHRSDLALQGDFRQLHRNAQRRKTIEALLRSSNELSTVQLQQISTLSRDLPPVDRGALLYQTAMKLWAASHHAEAYSLLNELTTQLPKHELSEAARIQMFTTTASLEGLIHWRLPWENSVAHVASAIALETASDGVQPAIFATPEVRSTVTKPDRDTLSARLQERERRAIRIAESIQAHQPDLYFEPMLRFPLAALQWRLGRKDEAASYWRGQMGRYNDTYWTSLASVETGRLNPHLHRQKASHVCRLTGTRPRLDGQLDNQAWADSPAMPLTRQTVEIGRQVADSPVTELRWAWDAEYLYLSANCPRESTARGRGTSASGRRDQPRQRDTDLTKFDRIEMHLDIDRDYVTHWQLIIDDRGWANDALNGDPSWNLTWYIASATTDESWTFEAAIPWEQISPAPPEPGDVWAVRVRRHRPGMGSQSWRPSSSIIANGAADVGLLIFE